MRPESYRVTAAALIASLPVALAWAQDAVPVAVVSPRPAQVTDQLRLTGTLTAERSARLSPRVDGLVSRVRVDAGDRVKSGAALIELDSAVASLALERAKAGTAEARARTDESNRLAVEARRLVAERHLPQTELARREADAKLAAAALVASEAFEREQAELVRRHTVPAPFAGVVARRLTDVGEWVARGTPVIDLVATDRVRLDVQAPQERFAAIREDAVVEVFADSLPGESLPGRVVARVPVSDPSARTFLVRILVDGAAGRLLPGTSATTVIGLSGSQKALVIPRDALLPYPDGSHSVFVVRESAGVTTALERPVKLGRGGAQVEILAGIESTDRVIVRGNERLRNGQTVRVTDGG
ncbi:MAG TPA: efflux RND transporter periplasmic adaptor subunit [Steroidobacteraceae bacterium]|nr:efflux RND transporter periplasmic adaptor subunit [Steroidobacteraceae bacterium]